MDVLRSLKRARVGIILPVLATTVGAAAVISRVEGTSYTGTAAGVLDRTLETSSSTTEADSALSRPPVFALPKLSNLARAARKPIVVPAGSATKLNVNGVRHPRVDEWMERLTTTHKRSYQVSLARKDKYEDMISSKLAARKMPQELIYLAMIESNFNPDALSPAKAVGLWQFMSATARRFGLTVGGRVDERRDPSRATDAALTYLSTLYNRFGSWYLAAAAYNSGEGTVQRAMRSVVGRPSGTDADFFRILPRLPRETQDYVPKLIAWARVGQSPERYGITAQPAANVLTRTPATRPVKQQSVARASGSVKIAAKTKTPVRTTTAKQRSATQAPSVAKRRVASVKERT